MLRITKGNQKVKFNTGMCLATTLVVSWIDALEVFYLNKNIIRPTKQIFYNRFISIYNSVHGNVENCDR